jgi:hypothetical protein
MSADNETLAERKRRLAADIARQRGELAVAYRDLAKPLLYTEYGLRGIGFIRQNPWLLTAVPAAFSTTTLVVSLLRQWIPARTPSRKLKDAARRVEGDVERTAKQARKSIVQHAVTWGQRGVQAFRAYQRIRKFFP